MSRPIEPSEPIAVIGLGGIFPGAPNIPAYWKNIIGGVDSVVEVPKDRWDWRLYYDPDPSVPDKTYSKIGGFVLDFRFDPIRLRIPPQVAEQMDPVQKMAVAASAEALEDSGYDAKPYDPERTAVILGNSMGGSKKESSDLRVYASLFQDRLARSPAFSKLPASSRKTILAEAGRGVKSGLSAITEDTMPGELSNVIAGRVANTFNLNGANFTVDAACASSLAALDQAVKGLRFRDYDMVLCGGVDQMMSPPAYVKFCKIGALSPDGSRPFDAGANGFVMGEGVGVCVLKRLSDALRSGDRIYALVRAVGSSSDGRGKGITAPNPKGQRLAVERAFLQLDYAPDGVGLLEAHGTSTKVGDVVEANAAGEVFRPYARPGSICLGSVKSQIGHLKAAAGVASLVKAALALRDKTLPPSIHFRVPNPGIDWASSPFSVIAETRDWPSGTPRRAHVSSFGFGGANFHVALEEAVPETVEKWAPNSAVGRAPTELGGGLPDPGPPSLGLDPSTLGAEAFLVHGATPDAVFDRISAILEKIPKEGEPLAPLARSVNAHSRRGEYCLCFAAESPAKLREKADYLLRAKDRSLWEKTPPLFKPKGLYPGRRKKPGKIGFLFPGQGSQYVDMLKDLCARYRVAAETFLEADSILRELAGHGLTEVLFTRGGETPEQRAAMEERIKSTEITQPAVLTADVALLRLLKSYGVRPDVVCGHSLGEYAALVASGILGFKDALFAVSARAKEMAGIRVPDCGKMASVAAPLDKVEAVLKHIRGYVAPANKNCPIQTVIAGESGAVDAAVRKFNALGVQAQTIRVSHAFHSKIVEPAQVPYRQFLERMPLASPKVPILSNVTAAYYPQDVPGIRDLLVAQIASPVEFIRQMERMYGDGVRLFIEVGPKRVLTAFVSSIFDGRKDAAALASNHPKRGGILEFNELLARLEAEGVELVLEGKDPPRSRTFHVPSYADRADGAPPADAIPAAVDHAPARKGPAVAPEAGAPYERWGFYAGPVVVSGIAAGTPGAWERVFREDNLDQLLHGQNLIGRLSDADLERQIDKNIVRLVKSAAGDHRLERIRSAAEVVQLAALAGEFDLAKEFGFKESIADAMDISSKLAVAAGLLALKDAGIPLVPTYKETSTGSSLLTGWSLPESMRPETGILFATAYPSIDSMASEVSRYLADKYRRKPLRELASLVESLTSRIKDPEDRAALEHWHASNFRAYQERYGTQGPYEFSREFLLRVMPLGHTQLAQWIGARGPGAQISAACASTTQAVAMAEDWIRLGRAKRVLVIAGDDVTSPNLREWIVTGFLASGAATTAGVVSEAALPFDRRRHGLILGMGAAALLVETGEKAAERGMRPLAELLASQFENSAFHATRLHADHVCEVMERLLAKAESRHGLDRRDMAGKTLFLSHETYTPARGGSASAEVQALKRVFGPHASRVVVANTKGHTGHSMGASIEDPIAIRALVTGRVPPIANYREPDPELSGITLSRGGEYDLEYAIRLGAGFGSQIALTLMRRVLKKGEERVCDPARRRQWLKSATGQEHPQLEVVCNTLRARDPRSTAAAEPARAVPAAVAAAPAAAAPRGDVRPAQADQRASQAAPPAPPIPAGEKRPDVHEEEVRDTVLRVVGEKTGYPEDMLELDLDMEADLGIDTVKQAELFGIIRERYAVPRRENIALKDYPTLRHVIRFVLESNATAAAPAPQAAAAAPRGGTETDVGGAGFHRWVPELCRRPPPSGEPLRLAGDACVLLLSRDAATARPFARAFRALGVPLLTLHGTDWSDSEKAVASLRKAVGSRKLQGLVHLSGLELQDFSKATPKSFQSGYQDAVRSLFLAAQALQPRLAREGAWLASATRGLHPLSGAVHGLSKALRHELHPARTVAVRFDASCEPAQMARALVAELRSRDAQAEIFYRGDARWGLRLVPKELPKAPKLRLNERSTVWVTGGGQGLGAECAKEIARLWKCRLALIGRTQPGPQAAQWASLDAQGLDALKRRMWEELKADAAKRATPALLEKEFSKVDKSARLHRTLQALRAHGAEARYIAADLSDPAAAAKIARGLGRSWAPDLVLHAAGLEESKLLADKTAERFDAVFSAKAHGAFHLMRSVPAKPGQTWVFFSSVVGRFGNLGQADYAAASDFLSLLPAVLEGRKARAVTVDLTAFSEIGMAARGGVERYLKSQGVEFMPPAIGVDAILQEALRNPGDNEVLLAGALGRLDRDGLLVPPIPSREGSVSRFPTDPGGGIPSREGSVTLPGDHVRNGPSRLIERVIRHEADRLVGVKEFSLDKDPWLRDHSIQGTPYVAGVMGLELFAEAAAELLGAVPESLEQVRFSLPIKLLRGKPVTARVLCARRHGMRAELSIESDFITPQGIKLGAPRVHFTAALPDPDSSKPVGDDPAARSRRPGTPPTAGAEAIYSAYFHGPSFRVLDRIDRVNAEEWIASYSAPRAPLWPLEKTLPFQPMLVEAAFQACGYRDLHDAKRMTLPDSIGRIWVRPMPSQTDPEGTLPWGGEVRVRFKGMDPEGRSVYDAEVFDRSGRLAASLRDYKMVPAA